MANFPDHLKNDISEASLTYLIPRGFSGNLLINNKEPQPFYFDLEVKHYVPSNMKVLTFHIIKGQDIISIIKTILRDIDVFKERAKEVKITLKNNPDFVAGNNEIQFSKSIYFNIQRELLQEEKDDLTNFLLDKDFIVQVRGATYVEDQKRFKKNHAFLSHDLKDGAIAEVLYKGLKANNCEVWYNSYEIGENVLRGAEKGIKESSRSIILVTKSYLSNLGYAQKEFDMIIAIEAAEKRKLILPIWYDVTNKEVVSQNAYLSSQIGYLWPEKGGKNLEQYDKEVKDLIDRVSYALKSSDIDSNYAVQR